MQRISQWCAKWKLCAVDYLTDLVRDPDDQLALIELRTDYLATQNFTFLGYTMEIISIRKNSSES